MFNNNTDAPYPYNNINVNLIEYNNSNEMSSIIDPIKGGKAITTTIVISIYIYLYIYIYIYIYIYLYIYRYN